MTISDSPPIPPSPPARARGPWSALGAAALAITLVVAVTGDLCAGSSSPLVGTLAPTFSREVVGGLGAAEADRLDLYALRGRTVILDFWASWCPPCRASVPALDAFADAHPEISVVGVDVEPNRSPAFVRRAHAELGARYPTVHDADGELSRAFQITGLPTVLVLGPDGVVTAAHVGAVDRRWLDTHGLPAASN